MKLVELRGKLFSQLAPRPRQEKILQSGGSGIVREITVVINERRDLRMRQDTSPDNGDEMNSNRETGILFCELDGLFGSGAGYHQTRAGQYAIFESSNDRLVDLL